MKPNNKASIEGTKLANFEPRQLVDRSEIIDLKKSDGRTVLTGTTDINQAYRSHSPSNNTPANSDLVFDIKLVNNK